MSKQINSIVLTATIRPHAGVEGVRRNDPRTRLSDYIDALRFYLTIPDSKIKKIVFLENSGFDLNEVEREIAHDTGAKKIEFISTPNINNDIPSKEYGEFFMLDNGIASSKLLEEDDTFVKITGRLKFLNLADFIDERQKEFDIMCDLHNVPFVGHGLKAEKYMDLRVFFCRVAAYKEILYGLPENQPQAISAAGLYPLVCACFDRYAIVPRFPKEAILSGVGARHNRDYNSGLPLLKRRFRSLARQALPGIWF